MKTRPVSAHDKLLRLQKSIFESIKAEAQRLLGQTPASIRKYERECQVDFRGVGSRLRPVRKSELIREVRTADVTFIADFHTFAQAQKTAIRIIRDAIRPGEPWLIGLELISSQYQEALDAYQAGELSLEQFHEIIHYKDEWGFPWENYEPIFEWARASGVRLIALNRPRELLYRPDSGPRKGEAELSLRDQWAAGIVTDLLSARQPASRANARSNGRGRMIVLYGELHVGTPHLPAQARKISKAFLKRPLRTVSVHQNDDTLYWKLARQGRELHTETIRLKRGVYCVLSSTPWAKHQSLVNWAEGGGSEEFPDYLTLMRVYGTTIAEFLGVAAPSFESVTVRTIEDADFVERLGTEFTREELRLIRFHVLGNHRLYIPRAGIAYLGSPSHNAAAELAAVHLLRTRTRSPWIFRPEADDFYRMVLESAFGFFGSLVLNPRRKCDLAEDHARRLRELARRQPPDFPMERRAREIARLALANERLAASGRGISARLAGEIRDPAQAPALMLGARYAGRILGKRLYHGVVTETMETGAVRILCLSGSSAKSHFNRYVELLQRLEGTKLAPTKRESL